MRTDQITPSIVWQVGGNARPTNHDYTHGTLPEMIDVVCQSGCKLLVVAVGVPPAWMVDQLHASKILVRPNTPRGHFEVVEMC